jgi:hypothetical protein
MQRFHFVHFVLAEDERDDQNTHRPSGRLKPLAKMLRVKSRFSGRRQKFADA